MGSIFIPKYPRGGGSSLRKSCSMLVFIKCSPCGLYLAQVYLKALISFFLRARISLSS